MAEVKIEELAIASTCSCKSDTADSTCCSDATSTESCC